jgi:hypothetical protein
MLKNRNCLFIVLIVFCIYSCKKEGNVQSTNINQSAIVGKWQTTKTRFRIYTLSGALVRDSTIVFTGLSTLQAWDEIYNTDGTAYVTTLPYKKLGSSTLYTDTSSSLTYKVSGSILTLYEDGGSTLDETDAILQLNASSMEIESTYSTIADSFWDLEANVTYKFIEDIYYAKQ